MKRELKKLKHVESCCPGHDDWPDQTYKNKRSKRARSQDKKKEHKYVRTLVGRNLEKELLEEEYIDYD